MDVQISIPGFQRIVGPGHQIESLSQGKLALRHLELVADACALISRIHPHHVRTVLRLATPVEGRKTKKEPYQIPTIESTEQ